MRLRSLYHFILLSAFLTIQALTSAAAAGTSIAPMCQEATETIVNPANGQKKIITTYKSTPYSLKASSDYNRLNQLLVQGSELQKVADSLRNGLYFPSLNNSTVESEAAGEIAELKAQLADYKQTLLQFAQSASAPARAQLRQQFLIYFSIAGDIIQSELYFNPFILESLDQYNSQYKINLSVPVYGDIFATFDTEIANLTYTRIDTNGTSNYEMVISQPEILTFLKRALARSKATRANNTAFSLTTRCLLGTEFIDRYVANNLMLMKIPASLPNGISGPLCGNITANQIFAMKVHDQTDMLFLNDERLALIRAFPSYPLLMSQSDAKLFLQPSGSFVDLGALVLFGQENLQYVKNKVNPETSNKNLNAQLSRFDQLAGQLYGQIQDLNPLNKFYKDPQIKNGLRDALGSCQPDAKFKAAWEDLGTAELINFFESPEDAITISTRLTGLSRQDYRDEIYRMITAQKIESLTRAAELVFEKYIDASSKIDIAALTAKFKIEVIEPAVKRIMANYEAQGTLDGYVNQVLSRRDSFYQPGESLQIARQQYDNYAIQAAVNTNAIMDPRTPLTAIPYSRSAIASYYSDLLSTVSPLDLPMFSSFLEIKDRKAAYGAYQAADDSLEKDFISNGYNPALLAHPNSGMWQKIKSAPNSVYTSLSRWWHPTDQNTRPYQIVSDRSTLQTIANALGINGKERPRNSLYDALFDQNLSVSQQAKFIQDYRESLAQDYINAFRILSMPNWEWVQSGSSTTPLYETLAEFHVDPQYDESAISSAIEIAIQNNVNDLKKLMPRYTISQLKPYIEKATILGSLFGQNELKDELLNRDLSQNLYLDSDQFTSRQVIFSELLNQYEYYRQKWAREEGYRRLVWDDVLNSTYLFINPINEAFGARLVFKFMPSFLRLSYISSFLLTTARDVHQATSDYWTWTMGVMGADAAVRAYYGFMGDSRNEQSLDAFNYTDSGDRTAIAYSDYLAQRSYYDAERSFDRGMFKQDIIWSAFPWIAGPAVKYFYEKPYQFYLDRNEALMEQADSDGNYVEKEQLQKKFEESAKTRFMYVSNTLHWEFKALKLADGTFTPSVLEKALAEIKQNGTPEQIARAEAAYRRIMMEIAKNLRLFASTKEIANIYTRTIFGSDSETRIFIENMNKLIQPGGG